MFSIRRVRKRLSCSQNYDMKPIFGETSGNLILNVKLLKGVNCLKRERIAGTRARYLLILSNVLIYRSICVMGSGTAWMALTRFSTTKAGKTTFQNPEAIMAHESLSLPQWNNQELQETKEVKDSDKLWNWTLIWITTCVRHLRRHV